uniref:Histidine kinase n=1 Tax=Marseillevirus LCMAC102 TaxID=2506603 RepID=A0A481YTK2_9VIRU|nr:MAG: uncharacterized protein LCMAC102_00150 [Marseillevirus LCMAC102]
MSNLIVEIYTEKKINTISINLEDRWNHITPDTGKILSSVCYQLARSDINYGLVLESLLGKIIDVTGSEFGSVTAWSGSFENRTEQPYLICLALGEKTVGTFNPGTHAEEKSMTGLFGHAIRIEKAIISNDVVTDPRSDHILPKGHPPVNTFLAIPLIYQHSIIGLIAIANSPEYHIIDVQKLLPLLDICGRLLNKTVSSQETLASRIQRTSEVDEAKDRFLATMSHELRTPLTGIIGMVTMLPDAGSLNNKQKEYIKNLTECAFKLTHLLNNILDFSKMASNCLTLQKSPLNINKTVRDAVKMIEGNILAKELELRVNVPKDIPSMIGDSQRIIQILSNLLGNSSKFTDNGFISISVKATKLTEKDDSEYVKKWKFLFEVQDTGIGIPYEEQDKIFEVFHQSSTLSTYLSNSGTGLGLSISRELVKLMGGKISVSSDGSPGKGTTFSFDIILDEEININALQQEHSRILDGAKILIVDDRSEMRLQLSDIMFKWKCIPQAVSSADEALQYLQYGMKFDVALVDIHMPNMSGVELAQELRQKYPQLPLIGISSIELSSGEQYFDYYMYKPIDQNVLFPALLKCLLNHEDINIQSPSIRRVCRSKLKILIAEDDHHNTFTINEMLSNLGYNKKNITSVEDGEKCVKMVRDSYFDVILMDIKMPKMGGIDATRLIKRFPNSPMIIAVSAAVQPSDKARCQRVGIDGYLAKPITKEKLDTALLPLIKITS